MFEYISQHPLAGVAIAALLMLTVFVWIMAIKSGRKRNEEREKIIAQLEKEKAIRNEFRNIDDTTFAEGKDDFRLVVGMCANVQMSIEKIEDMTGAFNELSEVKRNVYALGYVFDDGEKSLSNFFRSNGEPLLSAAKNAVDTIIGGRYAEIFSKAFEMFDENNEDVSVDEEQIKAFDADFAALLETDGKDVFRKAADYIRANKSEFLY